MLQNCSDKEAPHLKPSNQLLARTDTEQAINSKKELIGQSSRVQKCKAAARLQPWRSRRSKTADGEQKARSCPRRKTSPERHSGGQVLQVSRIEELGHVQAQFAAGFQEHAHIILQIPTTQRLRLVVPLCFSGLEDYCFSAFLSLTDSYFGGLLYTHCTCLCSFRGFFFWQYFSKTVNFCSDFSPKKPKHDLFFPTFWSSCVKVTCNNQW